jgi:hypothetical protein
MRNRLVIALFSVFSVSACGPTPAAAPPPSGPAPLSPPAPSVAPVASVALPAAPLPPSTPIVAAQTNSPPPSVPFPPAAIPIPFERSAKAGDGVWTPLPEGTPPASALFFQVTVHPAKVKRDPYVLVVAMRSRDLRLGLVAGREEPENEGVPKERRPSLVPDADVAGLAAVWNGGFKRRHGNYGFQANGELFIPPIDDACTIALDREGRPHIASHPALAPRLSEFVAFRQTPPCLVEGGQVSPRLANEHRERTWGAAEGGARDIRRSALGSDASGELVYYGFGDWVTATELATTLRAAGATAVAELDVNWSYPRFFWFAPGPSGRPRIAGTFVPKIDFSAERYVDKPSERDFFYATRR